MDYGKQIPGGWFDEERHVYRNDRGLVVPSTTQVFDILGLSDFSMVPPDVMEWKRQYGTAVHAGVQYLVSGDLDWDTLDEAIIAPVTGVEARLKEMKFEPEATEEAQVVTYCGMQYGMTLDLRGTIDHQGQRRPVVLDLKTGSKKEKYWEWQVGGYLIPQPKGAWVGAILQVSPDGKVVPHYVDVEAAKRAFHCLLAAAILKVNHGYAKIGK